MLQSNIYNLLCFIYNAFLKIFDIVGNLKKGCGYLDLLYKRVAKVGAKVGVKVATFHTGLLPSVCG